MKNDKCDLILVSVLVFVSIVCLSMSIITVYKMEDMHEQSLEKIEYLNRENEMLRWQLKNIEPSNDKAE